MTESTNNSAQLRTLSDRRPWRRASLRRLLDRAAAVVYFAVEDGVLTAVRCSFSMR
jgi:hypothetical protein